MTFHIDADIRKARTLPSEFYCDPAFFEISKAKIFARTWHLAAGPEIGSGLTPFDLLPGFFDEPLLLVSGDQGVHCLSNVCTHRGKVLIEEPCEAGLIRCGYHGRRFSLDGRFLSMPEFEGVEDFPSPGDDLTEVPTARWADFTFVSPDPAASFGEFVGDAAAELNGVDRAGFGLPAVRDYEVEAHWALYCENYLEGFHIPYVHRSLNEVVEFDTYSTKAFRYSSLQTGFDAAGNIAGQYLFIFPNLMFNFYPWGLSVNVVIPQRLDKTLVRFLTYVRDGATVEVGAGADLHGVELEDERVVESVQRGIRSRFYTHGRYSPAREQGTHHFHRLIAEFID